MEPFTRLYAYTKPESAAVPLSNATLEDVDGAGSSTASKSAVEDKASANAKGKASAKAKVGVVKKQGKK